MQRDRHFGLAHRRSDGWEIQWKGEQTVSPGFAASGNPRRPKSSRSDTLRGINTKSITCLISSRYFGTLTPLEGIL